jgi:hypothetical protein
MSNPELTIQKHTTDQMVELNDARNESLVDDDVGFRAWVRNIDELTIALERNLEVLERESEKLREKAKEREKKRERERMEMEMEMERRVEKKKKKGGFWGWVKKLVNKL